MHYITDYQLDIEKGFQCKVNGKLFEIYFSKSTVNKQWFMTNQFRELLIKLELNPDVAVRPYGKFKANHFCYCDSKQQCYDLCQSVVATYFKPIDVSHIKEVCKKSRRYLQKYYSDCSNNIVNFNGIRFKLRPTQENKWYWHALNLEVFHEELWKQFELTTMQVLHICTDLNILGIFYDAIITFENPNDAIKFTDYLIETYIIKKEKTYDTNRLRKERTSLSRGVKPAGSIIHGRRSKASVRCGCIKHQTCIGS